MSKVNLPKIDISGENASIEDLIDNLLMMRKELEYTLLNLNSENIPSLSGINDGLNKVVKDANGNSSSIIQNANQIALNVSDIDGNASSIIVNANGISSNVTSISNNAGNISSNSSNITQNANSISLNVTSINSNGSDISSNSASININANSITSNVTAISNNEGNISTNSSSISQNATNINLRVQKNDVINQINISSESIDINANKINLNGVTTMTGLAKVNGDLVLGDYGNNSELTFDTGASIKGGGSFGIEAYGSSFNIKSAVTLADSFKVNTISGNNNSIVDIKDDLDFWWNDIKNVGNIDCNTVNGKVTTGPYYSANLCYVDTALGNVVFRDSDGTVIASITDGAFV